MKKRLIALKNLLNDASIIGDENIFVSDLVHDSREVSKGALFVCLEGEHVDGHDFIPMAKEKGAVALLTERRVSKEEALGLAVLTVVNIDTALDVIAPFFFDYPAKKMNMIGITGTNGKTTTSFLVRDILLEAGYLVGLIGTIQIMIGEEILPTHNTTPDIVDLQRLLYKMKEKGTEYVVMEVSSHALDQGRVHGCHFDVGAFTNLTQDHLDYHKTFENYRLSKELLFAMMRRDTEKTFKTAVVNIDDEYGSYMLEAAGECNKLTYGVENEKASLKAVELKVLPTGASFAVQGGFGRVPLHLKITGRFNVYNTLAAFGIALAENIPLDIIKNALEHFQGVKGRFELVDKGQDFSIVIDYAHTPDGLANILAAVSDMNKAHLQGKIITVFGCGGDRDRTKRPIMGRVAGKMSDVVLVTSDNPRTEDPVTIVKEVACGVEESIGKKIYEKIVDRREAIFCAVMMAQRGDIVVIAGKGHENYQILKDKTIHFDDREVAEEALKARYQMEEH